MSSEGERNPELLRADKEQLDRAAEVLRGDEPGFVILVCPKDLVPTARDHMSKHAAVEIPEPLILQGSEDAFAALTGVNPEPTARVRSLTLGSEPKEALRALNWHREKLLRGAPVVLWLDGVDGLTEMREAAPDAYSFRDMVVLVRGHGGRLPQVPYKETRSILQARQLVARARTALERARAYYSLSAQLRAHGHLTEAENVARRGLEFLPPERHADDDSRRARAGLWAQAAMATHERGASVRQMQAATCGLGEIEHVPSMRASYELAFLLSVVPGPFLGRDRMNVEKALTHASAVRAAVPEAYSQACGALSEIFRETGDLRRARVLLDSIDQTSATRRNLARQQILRSALFREAGRLREAESCLQGSGAGRDAERAIGAAYAYVSAACWLERGELDIAERVIVECYPGTEPIYDAVVHELLQALALAKGDVESAQRHARVEVKKSSRFGMDRICLNACRLLSEATAEAYEANRLGELGLACVVGELEVAEDISCSSTATPLPWYSIFFRGLRADLLIRTDHRDEALDHARRALDLARTTCPDLIPETGRALADHVLRATKTGEATLDDALSVLAEVEPEAESRGMLKELARIRAARVLALVLKGEPPTAIELAMAALREALERTGAPRIKAETLLELAIRLPPETTLPDPLAIASETHALFVEMPMPAKEARSLELSGDVLAARGKLADAKRRYMTAKGILDRRGLGLRVPLITTKIERLG